MIQSNGIQKPQTDESTGSVAAVVVSYNRRELLRSVIEHILAQTHTVDEIIVVDNDSRDGTAEMVSREFSGVTLVETGENLGAAGGMATGMRAAFDRGHDWLWLWEDDTLPRPDALATSLATFHETDDGSLGMLHPWRTSNGQVRPGSALWKGRYKQVRLDRDMPSYDVDVSSFLGNLVPRSTLEAFGFPRGDYFMMWWEIEYCLRLRSAGLRIAVLPDPVFEHVEPETGYVPAPWRGYYQTRNQLAHAIERRSLAELYWWAHRQARFVVSILMHRDSVLQRLRFMAMGVWDGLRGQMGRRLDPPPPLFQGHTEQTLTPSE